MARKASGVHGQKGVPTGRDSGPEQAVSCPGAGGAPSGRGSARSSGDRVPAARELLFLSVYGHVGCFYFLVIVKNASMNILAQVFVWRHDVIFLGYMPRSRVSGTNANSMFNFLRKTISFLCVHKHCCS